MKTTAKVILGTLAIIVAWFSLRIIGGALGWFDQAMTVVQEEVAPAVLQKKYEWFKDASAQLDKKTADIQVYESRFKAIGGTAGACPQGTDRVTREQCMVWVQEVSGIIASYNGLAAEYNSEMAKWNWRFTNVGQLPRGASSPVPREYRPYQYQ